jgi:iron complex transport system substrate-binding protein
MSRIVSLIASSTEIVCALGFGDRLVGRSHECDYPDWVRRLPVCTAPKFSVDGRSYEIDQRVKAILAEGLSVYRVDAERLRELRPGLIVTQAQCEVCAVSLRDVERALCEWIDSRPIVVSLVPNTLADVWRDIRTLAEALGAVERGEKVVGALCDRVDGIVERAGALATRPKVAVIEWIDPLMAAGNWIPELVAMAGGVNLFGRAGEHSPWMTFVELAERDPDWILVIPCGFDIARTRSEMSALGARPEWRGLRAAREGRVALADGNQYFNRPGPRLVESLEILAEILHPERFDFGHKGRGWEAAAPLC